MKKASIVLLLLLLLWAVPCGGAFAADIVDSGTCGAQGDNLTWTLTSDGLLTISGTGAMADYPIYESAPWYCQRENIASLAIGDSVTNVGVRAFWNCSGLTSVTIGNDVTIIGDSAFQYCYGLMSVNIPDSVISIGNYTFHNCSGLTSLTIPASVTSIGECAFSTCGSLIEITVVMANPSYSSLDGVVFDKDKTELVCCPGGKSGAYTIPGSVTSIGEYAFRGCSGLNNVTIPDSVTSIGGSSFYECSGLTSVTIPDSVNSIPGWAFCDCSNLTSVTIPDSVTSIGVRAFSECSSLTSVTIPNSVTSIGRCAFEGCSGLTSVTIPDGITSIESLAFSYCSSLTSVTIPNGVTSIEGDAFRFCSGLANVTIPNSVTSIGECAFEGCSGLTSVTIPDSVTSIGEYAFCDCDSLAYVYFTGTEEQWDSISIGDYNDPLRAAVLTCVTGLDITGQPQDYTGDVGSTVKFTVKASGEGLTYQWWYRKGDSGDFTKSTLASGKKATYSMTLAERHDGWQYYCVVKDGYGYTAKSDTVTIHVVAPPTITTQPQSFTGAAGSTIKFTVKASGNELTYQWWYRKDDSGDFTKSTLAAGKKATFTMTMADKYDGWQYYCIVTDAYGQTAESDTVTIHKAAALAITAQPLDVTGYAGGSASFSVTAQGDGLTYQWYYQTATGTTWKVSPAGGNQTATLTVPITSGRSGYKYHCVIKDVHGGTLTSAAATLTVRNKAAITTQPADFYGAAGSTIKFTVKAAGDGLSYQWYYKKTGASSFAKSTVAAAKKATFSMTMADKYDGWQYYCVVKDTYGNTAQSNTVTIHKAVPLTITGQPADYTGSAGSAIKFTVKASGDGLTYQWYYKKTGATSFVKSTLSSGTKATFTMTMADKYDGWQYYCVVKDTYGNTAQSNTVTIHKATPLAITSQPVNYTGSPGSTIKLTVKAAGDGLTYQWYYKKTGASSFAKSTVAAAKKATFSMTMAEKYDGWQYYCVVKDSYGKTAQTDTVTIYLDTTVFNAEVLRLINEERAAAGLSPLADSTLLDQAASVRSREINETFSHTRPDGRTCYTALAEVGATYTHASENIAIGQFTPEEVVAGWMNSAGHRKNILTEDFTQTGIAAYPASGEYSGYAWVQFFTN